MERWQSQAERGRLEICFRGNLDGGSNPSLSALMVFARRFPWGAPRHCFRQKLVVLAYRHHNAPNGKIAEDIECTRKVAGI